MLRRLKARLHSHWEGIRSPKHAQRNVEYRCTVCRLGSEYGGWVVNPDHLCTESVVYSFGVGEDASFDRALMEQFDVQLHAFDPTPRSIAWVENQIWPANFVFHSFGVAARDGVVEFFPPENPAHVSHTLIERPATASQTISVEMKSLRTIVDMLGHRRIAVLKMDIEGAEYEVIEQMVNMNDLQIDQVLVEFHDRFLGTTGETTDLAVRQLRSIGFRIFHISPSGNEYSFIRI
jgi:FkbM family methyltransferase